jgi:hypothetical protein
MRIIIRSISGRMFLPQFMTGYNKQQQLTRVVVACLHNIHIQYYYHYQVTSTEPLNGAIWTRRRTHLTSFIRPFVPWRHWNHNVETLCGASPWQSILAYFGQFGEPLLVVRTPVVWGVAANTEFVHHNFDVAYWKSQPIIIFASVDFIRLRLTGKW